MKNEIPNMPGPFPYPSALDESQAAFRDDTANAIRLLAPAGCGKTMSILWRCKRLAEQRESDSAKLLLVTFTRAARDEVRARIESQSELSVLKGVLEVSTLNAWGYRVLRKRKRNLQVLEESDARKKAILSSLQTVWSEYSALKEQLSSRKKSKSARAVFDLIDQLKGLGFRHDRYESKEDLARHLAWLKTSGMQGSVRAVIKELHDLYLLEYGTEEEIVASMHENFMLFWREATMELYRQSKISFADQKYWPWIQLEKDAELGDRLSLPSRYHAILVDEFQDINVLDLELLRAISRRHRTDLTIVGDDDQAIYEWRGASPRFIIEPEKYIGTQYSTHTLSTNYRSPRNIVDFSARLISHNAARVEKRFNAAQSANADIRVQHHPELTQAIDFVRTEIRSLINQNGFERIGILSRKRCQLIPYQIGLVSEGVPFIADMDLNVLLSEAFNEVKKLLSIVGRAGAGGFSESDPTADVISLCDRVVRSRSGLRSQARRHLGQFLRASDPRNLAQAVDLLLKPGAQLKDAPRFHKAITHLLEAETVSAMLEAISAGFEGLSQDFEKAQDEVFYSDPPFAYLAEYAEDYGTDLEAFYHDIQVATSRLALLPRDEEQAAKLWEYKIQLMTALRAKGKEFDAIFILDANDGSWPSSLALTEEAREQERRLFYVAFTRARKRIYILTGGHKTGTPERPSPYLAEMGLQATAP